MKLRITNVTPLQPVMHSNAQEKCQILVQSSFIFSGLKVHLPTNDIKYMYTVRVLAIAVGLGNGKKSTCSILSIIHVAMTFRVSID